MVYAQPSNINVLNIKYNNEDIKVLEKFNTIGYYPDRLIQPEEGYLLKIMSTENTILYSFRFIPPVNEYLDGWDGNYNLGGIQTANKFNFSLTIPSFDNEKELIIENGKELTKFSLQKEAKIKLFAWLLIALLIGILLIIVKEVRKKSTKLKN